MMLSVCMIVRDEEAHLGRSLASVSGIADEIVVVDTGSSDGTPDRAREMGARVYSEAWTDDFAAARNRSLERARGAWILVLDADEVLGADAARRLPALLADERVEGYQLVQRSYLGEGEVSRYEDLAVTRLFRNRPAYRYEGVIHEQVLPSIRRSGGRVVTTDLHLLHYGYLTRAAQGGRDRAERNLRLLDRAVAGAPDDAYLHAQLGGTLKASGRDGEAERVLLRAVDLGVDLLSADVSARVYAQLAQLALKADRYPEAAGWAERALRRAPSHLVARHVLALALLFLGRFGEARAHLMAVRRSPHCSPSIYRQLDVVIGHCEGLLSGRSSLSVA